jgi:hypothetical protein
LGRVFEKNDYSIEQAYQESVSGAYSERDLLTRIEGIIERLGATGLPLDPELRASLVRLQELITRLL